jgi:hypothetical protein
VQIVMTALKRVVKGLGYREKRRSPWISRHSAEIPRPCKNGR